MERRVDPNVNRMTRSRDVREQGRYSLILGSGTLFLALLLLAATAALGSLSWGGCIHQNAIVG